MELNIIKLLHLNLPPEHGSLEFDFSGKDFNGFCTASPVKMSYTATPKHGIVLLSLHVSTTLKAECARCLAEYTTTWESKNQYTIRESDLSEVMPELPYSPQGALNLEELAYQELVLEVPPILVCNEDCKGLCQQCGKTASGCQCPPKQEGDPRLQILKQLLTD